MKLISHRYRCRANIACMLLFSVFEKGSAPAILIVTLATTVTLLPDQDFIRFLLMLRDLTLHSLFKVLSRLRMIGSTQNTPTELLLSRRKRTGFHEHGTE